MMRRLQICDFILQICDLFLQICDLIGLEPASTRRFEGDKTKLKACIKQTVGRSRNYPQGTDYYPQVRASRAGWTSRGLRPPIPFARYARFGRSRPPVEGFALPRLRRPPLRQTSKQDQGGLAS